MGSDQYVTPQEIFNGWWSSFLFLGSWERRLWMFSQGESKYLCTEWVWSPCMPLFIAEHSRREVISWHFVLSGWLGVCVQYAVAAPFHFLSSEKPLAGGIVIKSIYCCRDGSFSSARVSSFFPSVRQIFIFSWLNGFNLLPYCSVKWKKKWCRQAGRQHCAGTWAVYSAGYSVPIKTMSSQRRRCFSLRRLRIAFGIMWVV